jgi:hypothetical protein
MTDQLSFSEDFGQSPSTRVKWIEILARFGQELEELADCGGFESLLDVEVPAGLLLLDITESLELTEQEQFMVLGARLYDDLRRTPFLQPAGSD